MNILKYCKKDRYYDNNYVYFENHIFTFSICLKFYAFHKTFLFININQLNFTINYEYTVLVGVIILS